MNLHKYSRKIHYWGAIFIVLPLIVVIGTGVLLMLKKQLLWVQPVTQKGIQGQPTLAFSDILHIAQQQPALAISQWADIDRLDVRPAKGIIKVQANNGFELQLDASSGAVLQIAYRRSDWLESLHDGSWFSIWVKYGVFLPSAIVLFVLCITGIYLWLWPYIKRNRNKMR